MESNTAIKQLKQLDRSAIEDVLKNQTRVGCLIGRLAERIQDIGQGIAMENGGRNTDSQEELEEIYLSLKTSGELLYGQAVRTAWRFDLKSPEDSMWGN